MLTPSDRPSTAANVELSAFALTVVVLVGPFNLAFRLVGLTILTAVALAYLIRGMRPAAKTVVANARTLGAVQARLETPARRESRVRFDSTERHSTNVAGGTLMIDRTTFADVRGFRPGQVSEDAGLLAAVREGGCSLYRAQALGYLLRRSVGGHT